MKKNNQYFYLVEFIEQGKNKHVFNGVFTTKYSGGDAYFEFQKTTIKEMRDKNNLYFPCVVTAFTKI